MIPAVNEFTPPTDTTIYPKNTKGISLFFPIMFMISANPNAGKTPPATSNPCVTNCGREFITLTTTS